MLRYNGTVTWQSNCIKKYVQTLPEYINLYKKSMEHETKAQSESESDKESKDNKDKL